MDRQGPEAQILIDQYRKDTGGKVGVVPFTDIGAIACYTAAAALHDFAKESTNPHDEVFLDSPLLIQAAVRLDTGTPRDRTKRTP